MVLASVSERSDEHSLSIGITGQLYELQTVQDTLHLTLAHSWRLAKAIQITAAGLIVCAVV